MRTTAIPILIVGEPAKPIRRVLAAVDLSRASRPTLRAAQLMAQLYGARLRVVHVVEPFSYTDLSPEPWGEEAYQWQSEGGFETFIAPFKDVALEDRVVRGGAAMNEIVAEAATWSADVVVAGSHGQGWVNRVLIGSTTQRLVTWLPTSLLVVPIRETRAVTLALARRSPTSRARRRLGHR